MPRFARKHGVRVRGISDRCMAVLQAHHWPGNVRELQNVIERAVILCGDAGLIEPDHLGFSPLSADAPNSPAPDAAVAASPAAAPAAAPTSPAQDLLSLAEVEKRHIFAAMDKTEGNRTHAARLLGISVRTLRNKLNEYGVPAKYGETADAAEQPELPIESA
jgi:two-component system response regulator FlrC